MPTTKHASLKFRNRLENNSDHWNALFLSLRELAEWTVKKESELESMSPIGGDEATIRKQQVKCDEQARYISQYPLKAELYIYIYISNSSRV